MDILEILIIAIGLAMDAFAVSISKGMTIKKLTVRNITTVSLYFGVFQAFMPFLGYILGKSFESYVMHIDHWIAFILLSFIGANMIKEAFSDKDIKKPEICVKEMLPLAIATSIDALAIGITFAFLKVNILYSTTIIGIVTFIISGIGVLIGNRFGKKYGKKSELLGGIILIAMGIKILIEHLC